MFETGLASHQFNDSVFVYFPKGDEPQDQYAAIRAPGATRPLALKNCDAKLIAHVVNLGLVDKVRDWTIDAQQSFVKRRNFGQHALTLDSEARRAGHSPEAPDAPPIRAASPPFGTEFLFASPVAHGVPPGYFSVTSTLYHSPGAWARVGGCLQHMFEIGSVVLQGCPLSRSIWALASDARIRHLVQIISTLPGSNKLGVCADDL
eukprot:1100182-Pyramimonas_sp.AAC.1